MSELSMPAKRKVYARAEFFSGLTLTGLYRPCRAHIVPLARRRTLDESAP